MTLAALLDLGVDKDLLVSELQKLGIDGWQIVVSDTSKHGIGAKHVDVVLEEHDHEHHHDHDHNHPHTHNHEHKHEHTHEGLIGKITGLFHHHEHHHEHKHIHRNMADIAEIINKSAITEGAKDLALRIFMRLAVAEAKVHGTTPEKVHFHEVGAVDSIIDIVGAAICIDILSPDKVFASVLHDGYGFVKCQHGTIPIPVPAVTEVLAARGATIRQLDIEGEMLTPTGAAIVAELAESFGAMPQMKIINTGYGAGRKDFPIPNILRLSLGETSENTGDSVTVIETNIDDTPPEILGYVMKKLFDAGAKDVFFTPIYMKKARPATMISVICCDDDIPIMENILFTETSTIGLRKHRVERTCLPRKRVKINTPFGDVWAKEVTVGDKTRIAVEYDDACRLAEEKNVALIEIYRYNK